LCAVGWPKNPPLAKFPDGDLRGVEAAPSKAPMENPCNPVPAVLDEDRIREPDHGPAKVHQSQQEVGGWLAEDFCRHQARLH
jgi:hypothetical protein